MTSRQPKSFRRRFVLAILIILVLLAVPAAYLKYRLDLRPVQTAGAPAYIEFDIAAGENAQTIATRLKAASLIRDRNAFITYVNLHGLRPRLKVGRYSLSQTQSAVQIIDIITEGKTLTKRLVVPEGYKLSQIETAAAALGIDKTAFKAALDAPHEQGFLAGKPADVDLEGYLFPDSYEVTSTTKPADLVNAMLDNFGKRVGPEYVQALAAKGLTLH